MTPTASLGLSFLLLHTGFTSNALAFQSTLNVNSRREFTLLNSQEKPEMDGGVTSRRHALGTVLVLGGSWAASSVVGGFPTNANAVDIDINANVGVGGKIRYGDEDIMSKKEHGTTHTEVQEALRYGVSRRTADQICSFNRVFAEYAGYFQQTSFQEALTKSEGKPITFFDSVSGKPLFVAPIGRSTEEFLAESQIHGWPSFRDQEVVWDNVRILKKSGETVSVDGTHLGHNLPDRSGNRYCINLVSIAGNPV